MSQFNPLLHLPRRDSEIYITKLFASSELVCSDPREVGNSGIVTFILQMEKLGSGTSKSSAWLIQKDIIVHVTANSKALWSSASPRHCDSNVVVLATYFSRVGGRKERCLPAHGCPLPGSGNTGYEELDKG